MKTGDRVLAIKKLAGRMSQEAPSEFRMVLRQFGFKEPRFYDDDTDYSYLIRALETADDNALLELHEHYFPNTRIAPISDSRWAPGQFRLFLSHVSAKKAAAGALKAALVSYGIDAFVAHDDIEPTAEWVLEIEAALDTCHALAALMSEGFHESKWTDQEIGFCIKRRILVIPVRLGIDPYGFISRYQAFTPPTTGTAQEKLTALADGLFNALITHDLTTQHMTDAILTRFEKSRHYSEAKATAQHFVKIPRWTPEQLRRLTAAVENNSENADAFGVPEKVREIVNKHSW